MLHKILHLYSAVCTKVAYGVTPAGKLIFAICFIFAASHTYFARWKHSDNGAASVSAVALSAIEGNAVITFYNAI